MMTRKKIPLKWIICGFLIVGALVLMQLYPLTMLSVFSVSQITVQQQGYEDPATHEWKGSYWVIGLVTDTLEHYDGITYTFDNKEAQAANKIGEKTLILNSKITVTVIPENPYYERSMEYVTYTIYPKTYATWKNKVLGTIGKLGDTAIPELKATVLRFTVESWKLYTPFKIQLYKNGVLRDEKSINTMGGAQTVTLTADPGETLKVQNLGKLGTGLGEPNFGDLIIFDNAHIFKVESNILSEIQYDKDTYSYSNYWFGGGTAYYAKTQAVIPQTGPVIRWDDETKSPAHIWMWSGTSQPLDTYMFPGCYRADDSWNYIMKPVVADIFADKAKDKPVAGSPFGYSLINYLASVRGHKLYVLDDFNEYRKGIQIKDNKMRVYLPLGSFSNLATIWISTELADAIVYRPVAAKGIFIEDTPKWLGSGSISDKDIVVAKVKQEGKDGGKITITASGMIGYPMSVSPAMDSVILNYGETYTFYFMVKNLGTGSAQSGSLMFALTNDQGTETDKKTVTFELKPQIGDKAILTVNLYDKEGYRPSGILVTVNYGVSSQSGVASNGYVTFDLDTYKGGVSISTQETDTYRAASTSTTVSAGQNSVFLELQKKTEPLSIWDWIISHPEVIAILAIVVVAVVLLYRRR